ncbi:hypothetical protein ACFSTH_08120 [Paenibacillus yanchengensis]|uniref:Uncharacterized protein n=1 Tax=Paenibacillus yanchengensis TaxID=2035833 RepID=A0ABW4YLI4_9BACL
MSKLEIGFSDVKEILQTSDEEQVNEMLEDGWILLDATRGNLKYLFLLVRV